MSAPIWIDENIDNKENTQYIKELKSIGLLTFCLFKSIDEAIGHMKKIGFQETKVIINGKLYSEFVKKFKKNISEMSVVPKIIIFTKNKEIIENNKEYQNNINSIYTLGGIATTFDEIKYFLKNEIKQQKIKKEENIQLTFEYIDSIEKLQLPIFFKCLIDNVSNDKMEEYTNSLYNTYSRDNNEIKILLDSIKSTNIPIEILSKYYARLYTIQSKFYADINKELGSNKREKYLPFIKTLYEGVKLKSLKLASDKNILLYRGSKIENKEVSDIKKFLSNKKSKDLPGAIAFSKSFLSFSKERAIAESFLNDENKNKNLSKVLYILEKDDNIGYNLSTHADIETISYFPNEKEVLFFPFSSFEIKEIKEINIGKEKGYEIKILLLYLGKYLKEIEKNKNIINEENKIPESEFKKQLCEFGLIKEEKIKNINNKILYKEYKKYEKDIEENNNKNNIIIGEINISSNDINKDIQIINSFENYKRIENIKDKEDDYKYENEKEIKENIEIRINGKEIKFKYEYKFNKEGKYQIEYLFKKDLTKTNHMFYNCKFLTTLNLSNFNAQNVTNMNHMFSDCESLINLDLSNFNTQKVTNMNHMFSDCKSLKNLDLSNFDTQNVIDISYMFYYCNSLTNLDLSNFDTQNATDMSYMFSDCKSLTNLNLSNFNTQKVTNMNHMFSDCNTLTDLNLSNFDTHRVTNMNYMFSDCNTLTNLNLSNFNTQNVTDMSYMFYSCESTIKLNLSNFNTKNVSNMNNMFSRCKKLKNLDISKFNTKNVSNMNHMFNHCESLINLDLSNFNTHNVTNMSGMFFSCEKLKKLNLSNFNTQNVTNMNNMFNHCRDLEKKNFITKDKKILNNFDNKS